MFLMNKEINLFVFNWQKYHIDLNTLSVLKSGSKSKCWHLRLSDVGGHHDADFGTLTRLLTKNTCYRIPKIMEQFCLKDIVCDIAPWNDSCNNLSLISPLIHIQINIYIYPMKYVHHADCGSLISILIPILILGWVERETGGRVGRLGWYSEV